MILDSFFQDVSGRAACPLQRQSVLFLAVLVLGLGIAVPPLSSNSR